MKYILLKSIISVSALLMTVSCNTGPKPDEVAEEFLNSYFATDYEAAAKLCTAGLGKDLLDALNQMQALDTPIRENIQKHTKYYKPQIIHTEQPEKKDSVVINYIVLKSVADSLDSSFASNTDKVKESRLHLIKTEEGWKVAALK